MVQPLYYEDAIAKEGDDKIVLLTVPEQFVLLVTASRMKDNPGSFFTDYVGNEEAITDFIDTAINAILDEKLLALQDNITLFHQFNIATFGNNISPVVDTTCLYNHNSFQTPSAIEDQFVSPKFRLRAGNYRFVYYIVTGAAGGILTTRLTDGTDFIIDRTDDTYSAALTPNVKKTEDFELTEDKELWFTGGVGSKNASSIAYNARVIVYNITRLD